MATETVEEIIAVFFCVGVESISDETGPRVLAEWDSMKHIELIMTLEMKYGIQFSPAEIPLLTSVGKIKELINTHT